MEFREMRRGAQALPETQAWEILQRGSFGVLAVAGDGGYPYAVPLNYACLDGKIYIHCALEGHKLDAIRRQPRVSFCVVDQDQVVPEEYANHYRSAIAFGQARILEAAGARTRALAALGRRYCAGGGEEAIFNEIREAFDRVAVIEIAVSKISGKEALALARQRLK